MRLHRRAARRVDHQRDRLRIAGGEGAVERARDPDERKPGRSGVEKPITPDSRTTGTTAGRRESAAASRARSLRGRALPQISNAVASTARS